MSIKNLPADYLLAAQQGDIDKVKTCLALGVDINTCDRQGKTAITLASLYQQYACVQALIDAGADINIDTQNKAGFYFIDIALLCSQ